VQQSGKKIEGFIIKTGQDRLSHGGQAAVNGLAADGRILDMAGQFCRGCVRRAAGFFFYFCSGVSVEIESPIYARG